jgi:heavy metal sensor kinase
MTIRTRLTLWYSSLLATLILVFGISLFSILNWAWRSQVQENMLFVSKQIANSISIDQRTGQLTADIPEGLEPIAFYSFGIQIRDSAGALVGSSAYLSQVKQPYDAEMLTSRDSEFREQWIGNKHALVMTAPIVDQRNGNRLIGTIQIASLLTTIDAATDRLFKVMLGVGGVALILSFIVGSVIAGQALQPIDTISHTAKQITDGGDLSKRIEYDGPSDELGQLIATFNATLERLERSFNLQRRFVGDVSHELRTPLTTIQGNLDLMKRFGPDPTSIDAMDSEVKRMTRMVGDLLLLAQADSGRLPLADTRVELGTLVLEVFQQAKVLAKDVEIRLATLDPVSVRGDPDRLKQLVLNLTTNAIKYTPAGGHVILKVTDEGGYAFIRVQDTGIGIPREDIEHIFERFYRVDKARSRQLGGAGLGLSIARWIVEAHRGKIWVESEVNQGSTFIVQLPNLDAAITPDPARETRPRIPAILRRPRADKPDSTMPAASAAETRRNRYEQVLESPQQSSIDGAEPDGTDSRPDNLPAAPG